MRTHGRMSALEAALLQRRRGRIRISRHRGPVAVLFGALGLLLLCPSIPVLSQDGAFAGRPGLADVEREPAVIATCEDLQASLEGLQEPRSPRYTKRSALGRPLRRRRSRPRSFRPARHIPIPRLT